MKKSTTATNLSVNVLLWNIRSLNGLAKRAYLTQVLVMRKRHIAIIQETFLINEDYLYLSGWKVYRVDGQRRRKGCLIKIDTRLNL